MTTPTTTKTLPNFPTVDQRHKIACKLFENLKNDHAHHADVDGACGPRSVTINGFVNLNVIIDAVIALAHEEMEG